MTRRYKKADMSIAECKLVAILEYKLRREDGQCPVGSCHRNLPIRYLAYCFNAAGMIVVTMCDKQIPDVCRIKAEFANCIQGVASVVLIQGINHDQAFAGNQQISTHETGANVIKIIKQLDGASELLR